MKNEKLGFSYAKNMANFEAFHEVISSGINILFLKCVNGLDLLCFVLDQKEIPTKHIKG